MDAQFSALFKSLLSDPPLSRLRLALLLKTLMFDSSSSLSTPSALTQPYIYNRLHSIMALKDTQAKIDLFNGINTLVELVGLPDLETSRIGRFLDQMMLVAEIAEPCADLIGRLCRPGWTLYATYFEYTLGNCIEALLAKLEQRRRNALLILSAFAKYNPGLMYPKMPRIVRELVLVVRDPARDIREKAAALMHLCLKVLAHREGHMSSQRFRAIYTAGLENTRASAPEHIHAGLLLMGVLVRMVNTEKGEGGVTAQEASEYVEAAYERCWTLRAHRNEYVRAEAMHVIPWVVEHDPKTFLVRHMPQVSAYYLLRLRLDRDHDRVPVLGMFSALCDVSGGITTVFAGELVGFIKEVVGGTTGAIATNQAFSVETEGQVGVSLVSNSHSNLSTISSGPTLSTESPMGPSLVASSVANTIAPLTSPDTPVPAPSGTANLSSPNNTPPLSSYKGAARFALEKALFSLLTKLCETLGARLSAELTLGGLVLLLIAECTVSPHLIALLRRLTELYPSIEAFILLRLLAKITLFLGGCDFVEPGVSIASLNLSDHDRSRLLQNLVIGVHFQEKDGMFVLAQPGNPSTDDVAGNRSRAAELRRRLALHKTPYSLATAPLSNRALRDVSAAANSFTATHEAHVATRGGDKTHYVSIQDLVDLDAARAARSELLAHCGFVAATHSEGVLSALLRLTGIDRSAPSAPLEVQDAKVLAACLDALASFPFGKYVLLFEYARYVTLPYTEHAVAEVRMRAARVTAELFAADEVVRRVQIGALTAAAHVLARLLLVAVTDRSASLRSTVLHALGPRFDAHLAQLENVRLLIVAVHDRDFEVRAAAVRLLARVLAKNPAYVVPALRKILLELVGTVRCGADAARRECACALLAVLVGAAELLAQPHAGAVMSTLLGVLKENDGERGLRAAAISCVGEVARVLGAAAAEHLYSALPVVLSVLHDRSALAASQEKVAALDALAQLVRSSGRVVEPYERCPELLGELTRIVVSPGDAELKKAAIRLQGVLGALDPYRAKQLENKSLATPNSKEAPVAPPKDWLNVSDIAKRWGHLDFGVDLERGIDLNEMLGITDTSNRIPRVIQQETLADTLLVMQLNVEVRPLSVSEDYYLIVVLYTLVRVLNDSSAGAHHIAALLIILSLFRRLRDKCLGYTKIVVVGIIRLIRAFGARSNNPFNILRELTKEVGKYIRPAVPDMLSMVVDFFPQSDKGSLILLVEEVANSLGAEFKLYIAQVLPTLLGTLQLDAGHSKEEEQYAKKAISAFVLLGLCLEEHLCLIVSSLLSLILSDVSVELKKSAMEAVGRLANVLFLLDLLLAIVHNLLDTIDIPALQGPAIMAILLLMLHMRQDFFIYVPVVEEALSNVGSVPHPIDPQKDLRRQYDQAVHRLIKNEPVAFPYPSENSPVPMAPEEPQMREVDVAKLQVEWRPFACQSRADWVEWAKNLALKVLEYLPLVCLLLCAALARVHPGVARDLFNSLFAAVWLGLGHVHQAELATCLTYALQHGALEVVPIVLNLAEFMEHNGTLIPIPPQVLLKQLLRHHAFAKALHYKEREFKLGSALLQIIDALMNINNLLQQSDAGNGLLTVATETYKLQPKELWFQKLQKWNEAKSLYENKLAKGVSDIDVINGKMSCLHALGEWDELALFTESNWLRILQTAKEKVAPLAAAAAWGTSNWSQMDEYILRMKQESANKYFFSAILQVHRCNYVAANEDINKARDVLGEEMTPLASESYGRAYDVVVRLQMLLDLEEIIEYKRLDPLSPRREVLRNLWDKRLFACQPNVDVWQRLLNVRSLVVPPENDLHARIRFANLCRNAGRFRLAEQTLAALKQCHVELKAVPGNQHQGGLFTHPALVYAQLKLLWASGAREKAFATMCLFTYDLSGALCLGADALVSPELPGVLPCEENLYYELRKILCKCFLKQGVWQMALQPEWVQDPGAEKSVLGLFLIPAILHELWYKGHHYWAMANYEILSSVSGRLQSRTTVEEHHDDENESRHVLLHAVPACAGFIKLITVLPDMALQDLLRLLALWFAYLDFEEVSREVEQGIAELSIETWLPVLPQLFSRLHLKIPNLNNALLKLLTKLGEFHPQALLFPLNVSAQLDKEKAVSTAQTIIQNVGYLHPRLVDEASRAVNQMIRVALLLNERWFNAIERTVSMYQTGHFLMKIVKIFEDLVLQPRELFHDKTFWLLWGSEVTKGYECIVKYKKKWLETGISDLLLLQLALNRFAPLHAKLSAEFGAMKVLYLEYVAPALLEMRDLDLTVPGTYQPGKTVVGIARFENKVPILGSKQRPRRFFIYGQDGKLYDYLLKGQEDIRQDNMVMQLFGLVNRLLDGDSDCLSRHLVLEPYPTIPLSPKSGLIGWVPNLDTFNTLITQNRNFKGMQKDTERRTLISVSGKHYDYATHMRRLEVFLASIATSDGMDMYDVLWLKSRSSEAWLERRTGYVRSLALTSVVGYVLGLGDRHPLNIMIHRVTGKVIHIDYGDCFESAMLRDKWPEQVPFRLTRMLVNALEALGIEGSFKITFYHVLRVIRSNKDYLMALFDSFARDPLIMWGFDIPNKEVMRRTNYETPKITAEEYAQMSEEEYQRRYDQDQKELMDARALYVLGRISSKLTGDDFKRFKAMLIEMQVEKLIEQATDVEALAMHFIGWCAFW